MHTRGFILQPSYRVENRNGERVPVVHLHGVLETGETFLVRDDRQTPCFFIRAEHTERAAKLGIGRVLEASEQSIEGYALARVETNLPDAALKLRDLLRRHGIPCYEADLRFAIRFLIDRGIRGSFKIDGDWKAGRGIDRVYDNPQLQPATWAPRLTVLSIDIETDLAIERVLSIALFGAGASEVLLMSEGPEETPKGAISFTREDEMLRTFCQRVRELDPDILTGWNFIDFDLRVLDRVAQKHRVRMDLARGRGTLRLRPTRSPFGGFDAQIPGRVVLDGIQLLRGSFIKMANYGLGAVAKEVLGEGKLLEGSNRGLQIMETFKNDRQTFVDYNLTDARLVADILDKLQLIELSIERSALTGLPIDRVAGSIAALDSLYLTELHRRGIVAPSVGQNEASADDLNLGGHVLEPAPGLYENVLVFDFKSLYPSLMRTFQIDPLGFLDDPKRSDDAIVAPNGAAFRREPGILPAILDELFPRREAAKQVDDKVTSHAIKILMNSFYGVLGTSSCRFYRPQMATAITSWGRDILLWTKARFESKGFLVLYGDTDSLFILSGEKDSSRAQTLGEQILDTMNLDVANYIDKTWRVESRLELEFEKLYKKLFLPPMRGRSSGARKRYVGLLDTGLSEEVEFIGMEVVRRDWTDMAKTIQRELYTRLFQEQDVEDYLRRTVDALRGGDYDAQLVYRKALRKPLEEYTATTPPHVAAARKMKQRPGRLISYLMTTGGPESAIELKNPIDHEHYVQKQVKPVAEPVLGVLGLDFDKVIGDDAQLTLF